MTTSLTSTAGTITPTLVNGFQSSRTQHSSVIPIIGSNAPAVNLQPGLLRSGTLDLIFSTLAAAIVAETLLAGSVVWTMTENASGYTGASMMLVVVGETRLQQSEERGAVTVTIRYQEVSA